MKCIVAIVCGFIAVGLQHVTCAAEPDVAWTGEGTVRLIVETAPIALKDRNSDELPAEVKIDFVAELAEVGIKQLPDLATVQVVEFDPATCPPRPYDNYANLIRKDEAGRRFEAGFDPKLPPIMQPRVIVVDLNGDGDDDLFLPSTQGSSFVERSFLEHGYAQGKIVRVERK